MYTHKVIHSRLHGIDSGTDNVSVLSSSTGKGSCVERRLCMCRDGLIGDGIFQKRQVSSHYFSVDNDWTNVIDKSQILPYPVDTVPYLANSCESKVCKPGWICLKKE